jgi:hypothetical protein
MLRSLDDDEDQGAEVPAVVGDRRRRARSAGQRRDLRPLPSRTTRYTGHLRTGKPTRCANRPVQLVILLCRIRGPGT